MRLHDFGRKSQFRQSLSQSAQDDAGHVGIEVDLARGLGGGMASHPQLDELTFGGIQFTQDAVEPVISCGPHGRVGRLIAGRDELLLQTVDITHGLHRSMLALRPTPLSGDFPAHDDDGQTQESIRGRDVELFVANTEQDCPMDRLHQIDRIEIGSQRAAQPGPRHHAYLRLVLLHELEYRLLVPGADAAHQVIEGIGSWRQWAAPGGGVKKKFCFGGRPFRHYSW